MQRPFYSLVLTVLCLVHMQGLWSTSTVSASSEQLHENIHFHSSTSSSSSLSNSKHTVNERMIDLDSLRLELLPGDEVSSRELNKFLVENSAGALSNLVDAFSVEITNPTESPTVEPTSDMAVYPTFEPTLEPGYQEPTFAPTVEETDEPTEPPTIVPTIESTEAPTLSISSSPSEAPSELPTTPPTTGPTIAPTAAPSVGPSTAPTTSPTTLPTASPSTAPTRAPTAVPSLFPTVAPSVAPTAGPTVSPSKSPTVSPTVAPTPGPTAGPTTAPTTYSPTHAPSLTPTIVPTAVPSFAPSPIPSATPTLNPSRFPTRFPTVKPTAKPSVAPSLAEGATDKPTVSPTFAPTYSTQYYWEQYFSTVKSSIGSSDSSDVVYRASYSELRDVANSKVISGSCSSWKNFLSTDLTVAKTSYLPSSIELIESTVLDESTSSVTTQCSNDTAARLVVDAMLSPSSTATTIQCSSSQTWVVQNCTSSIAVCIGCSNPCTETSSSLRIAPCGTTATSFSSYVIRSLSVGYENFPGIPDVSDVYITGSSSTSVTVAVTLSDSGSVYVGIYRQLASPSSPSSVDSVILQNHPATLDSETGNYTVTINGLLAATDYSLYFVTLSTFGLKSTLSTALSTQVNVSTECCRDFVVSISSSSILEEVNVLNFLTQRVSASPQTNLYSTYTLYSIDTSALTSSVYTTNQLSPSSMGIVGGKGISAISSSASLGKLPTGTYGISVALVGTNADDYSVSYSGGLSTYSSSFSDMLIFSVLSSESPLPAPALSTATFSNDGSYVTVTFNKDTDKGGLSSVFTCSSIFSFTCASTSTCYWIDSATVRAFIATSDSCLAPGNSFTLLNTTSLRAKCPKSTGTCSTQSSWPKAITKTVTVGKSSSSISPTVSISMPSTMGSCASLTIDAGSSSGNGGRSWSNVSIDATAMDSSGTSQSVTALNTYLDSNFAASSPLTIASSYFTAGLAYNFEVMLCNFLGKCSKSNKRVTVVSNAVPLVSIAGSSLRTTKKSEALSIVSKGSMPSTCSSSDTISYSWSTYVGTTLVTSLTSSSKNPARFLLSAYSLTVNTMYTMKVTATASSTGTSSTSSVQVYVAPGDVNIVLAKSSSTYSVQRGSSLTIDASSSYDDDVASLTGVDAGLLFYWSCVTTSPNLVSNCSNVFTEEVDSGDLISGYISALALYARDDIYSSTDDTILTTEVTLTIYDSTFSRSATSTFTVYVLPTLSPVISFSFASSFGYSLSLNKINADDTLTITGTVLSPASLSATMNYSLDSATSSLVDLSSNSLTPIQKSYSAASANASSTVTTTVYLALPANVLTAGLSYTFYLSAYLASPGQSASSSITIKVNAPPTPGYFTVTPTSGTAMDTTFTFLCERWSDEDLPLTYMFGYISAGEQNVMLRIRSETAYADKQLAAGLEVNDYVLTTLAYIYDAFDASTSAYDTNTVEENNSITDDDISDFVESTYSTIDTADIDDIKQNVALSHYLLNMINCTLAPNCTSLNRMDCYRTAQTCGPCRSDDYIGDKGDANTMCYADASSIVVSSTTLKTCGNDCSGHGTCTFYSLQSNEVVSTCYEGEVNCYASCACDEDYALSLTCSKSNTDIESKRDQRKQLFAAFETSLGKEDVTVDSFRTWLATIVEVSQNPEEISDELVTTLTSILSTLLSSAKSVGATNSEISNIMLAMRSLTKATEMNAAAATSRRRLSETSDVNITVVQTKNSLKTYADYVSTNLVPGQSPVEYVKDGFRIYVEKYDVSDHANSTLVSGSCDANVTITMPQTAAESASGLEASTFTVPTCSSSGETELTVTSVILSEAQYSSSVNTNLTLNSDVFTLFFSEYPCFETESCYMNFVVQRTYLTNDSATPTRIDTTCGNGDYETYLVECSATEIFNVTCNGTASIVTTICPLTTYTQECDAVYGVDVRDVGCSVESFTSTNITCKCPIYTDYDNSTATRRRLSTIPSGEVSSSFANMLQSSTSDVDYAITLITTLEAGPKGFEVYVTIGVLLLSTLIMWYYAVQWDDKDRHSYFTSKFNFLQSRAAYLEGVFGTGNRPTSTGTNPSQYAAEEQGKVKPLVRRNKKRDPNSTVYRVSSTKAHETEDILAMADEALPKILSSRSFLLRILTELVHEHRWMNVVFHFDEAFTRSLRIFALFTNLLMVFFVLSFTFHYTETKGKEECYGYSTSSDCTEASSAYLTGQSMCYWDGETSTCNYQNPEHMERILLVVAVFTALVTYPCFYFINNFIVRDILAAPLWDNNGPNQLVEPSVDYFYPDREQQIIASSSTDMIHANNATLGANDILASRSHDSNEQRLNQPINPRPKVDMVDVYVAAQSEYQHLSLELLHFRSDLTAEERRLFDVHWGLNIDGQFRGDEKKFPTNVSVTAPWCSFNETIPVALRVQADVRYAIQNHFSEATKNKVNGLNDRMKSIRLLYWFQLDLMSKTNAYIVNRKNSKELYCLTLRPVKQITKTLAWTFMWLLNIGMLFFTLWFAVRKDKDLEQAWARSFAAYLVLDMIFTASVAVLIQHVLIPLTASREIDHIKETLIETLINFSKDGNRPGHKGRRTTGDIEQNNAYLNITSFNAAKFIFVSSRLAMEYANLKVAKVISSFRTSTPVEPYSFRPASCCKDICSWMMNLPTKTLMYYVSLPGSIQDLSTHITFTCLMGYMFYYLIQLFNQRSAYVAITILIFAALALVIYAYCAAKQPYDLRRNIVFDEFDEEDEEVPTFSSRKAPKDNNRLPDLTVDGNATGPGTLQSKDSGAFLSPKFRPKPSKNRGADEEDQAFDDPQSKEHGHDADFDVFKSTIKRYIKKNQNPNNKVIDGDDENEAVLLDGSTSDPKPSMGGPALLPAPSPLSAVIDNTTRTRPAGRKGQHSSPRHFFPEDENENVQIDLGEEKDGAVVPGLDEKDNDFVTIEVDQSREESKRVVDDDGMVKVDFDDDEGTYNSDDALEAFTPREDDVERVDSTLHTQPLYNQQQVKSFVNMVKQQSTNDVKAIHSRPTSAVPQQHHQQQPVPSVVSPRDVDDAEYQRLMRAHQRSQGGRTHEDEEEFDVIGNKDVVHEPDFSAFEPREEEDEEKPPQNNPQEYAPNQRSVVRMPQPSKAKKAGSGSPSRSAKKK